MTLLNSLFALASGIDPEHHKHLGHQLGSFALHLFGMWLNFVVSAIIVVLFLTRAAAALKIREYALTTVHKATLKNEQILAIATLAEHKLSTPLSTMAVVLHERQQTHAYDAELCADLQLLRTQVDECKRTLLQTLAAAGQTRNNACARTNLDTYLDDLLENWQLIRSHTRVSTQLHSPRPARHHALPRKTDRRQTGVGRAQQHRGRLFTCGDRYAAVGRSTRMGSTFSTYSENTTATFRPRRAR